MAKLSKIWHKDDDDANDDDDDGGDADDVDETPRKKDDDHDECVEGLLANHPVDHFPHTRNI